MTFHPESIDADQLAILQDLEPFTTRHGFCLRGGTAIALYLGHRRSVDFDWFTGDRLTNPMRLAQNMRDDDIPLITGQVERGTLHGRISGVMVSFFEYRYPLLEPLVNWSTYGLSLAGLDDLACMKLSSIAQRGTKKDFVDLHVLVTKHKPLRDLIELYRRKYRTDDTAHLLYALAYFDDADYDAMPLLLWDLDWQEVKRRLRESVEGVAG